MLKLAVLFTLLGCASAVGAQEAPKLQRVSGSVLAGKAIERPQPAFPQMARAAGIEGAVVVEVTVDETGHVVGAHAVSGHPLLRDAAVQAAREWVFTPTKLVGSPVKVVGTIMFNFVLPVPESDGPPVAVTTEALYKHRAGGPLPAYPAAAAREGVEGMVQVRVTVASNGRVTKAEALSGPKALLDPSEHAAGDWRFEPIEVDDKEVAVVADMYFGFEKGAPTGQLVLKSGEPISSAEDDVVEDVVPSGVAGGVPGGIPGGVPGGVPGDIPSDVPDGAPAPEGAKVVRVSSGSLAGKAVERPQPDYPDEAKSAGVSGAVVVEVTIDEAGRVVEARAIAGHPLLRDAAVQAARGWVFTPTELEGSPVKVVGTITFNFVAR